MHRLEGRLSALEQESAPRSIVWVNMTYDEQGRERTPDEAAAALAAAHGEAGPHGLVIKVVYGDGAS